MIDSNCWSFEILLTRRNIIKLILLGFRNGANIFKKKKFVIVKATMKRCSVCIWGYVGVKKEISFRPDARNTEAKLKENEQV